MAYAGIRTFNKLRRPRRSGTNRQKSWLLRPEHVTDDNFVSDQSVGLRRKPNVCPLPDKHGLSAPRNVARPTLTEPAEAKTILFDQSGKPFYQAYIVHYSGEAG